MACPANKYEGAVRFSAFFNEARDALLANAVAHLLIYDQPADAFLAVPRTKFVAQFWSPCIAQQRLDNHIRFVI